MFLKISKCNIRPFHLPSLTPVKAVFAPLFCYSTLKTKNSIEEIYASNYTHIYTGEL